MTVSRPPVSPSCDHRLTPPSSSRPAWRRVRSAGGRRTCTANTSGSLVAGSGSSGVVGSGDGTDDEDEGAGLGAGVLSVGVEQATRSSSNPTPTAALITSR